MNLGGIIIVYVCDKNIVTLCTGTVHNSHHKPDNRCNESTKTTCPAFAFDLHLA